MGHAARHLQKFWRLSPPDRRLLVTTVLLLTAMRLGLWLLPFRTLRRGLARHAQTSSRFATTPPERIGWAVATAGRYVPGATCLTQALAAQFLLERRGYSAHLRIGMARRDGAQFEGHAWVEHEGQIIFGRGFSPELVLPGLERESRGGG